MSRLGAAIICMSANTERGMFRSVPKYDCVTSIRSCLYQFESQVYIDYCGNNRGKAARGRAELLEN